METVAATQNVLIYPKCKCCNSLRATLRTSRLPFMLRSEATFARSAPLQTARHGATRQRKNQSPAQAATCFFLLFFMLFTRLLSDTNERQARFRRAVYIYAHAVSPNCFKKEKKKCPQRTEKKRRLRAIIKETKMSLLKCQSYGDKNLRMQGGLW